MEQSGFMVFALCILKLQLKYLGNCFMSEILLWVLLDYFEKSLELQVEFHAKFSYITIFLLHFRQIFYFLFQF